jgi:predicted TIM-barrel fold metal-dependent hydrolase
MIVDSHLHVFPYLGDAAGFATARDHLDYLRMQMCHPPQPVRRLPDHAVVEAQTLYDESRLGPGSFTEADFRVGRFGKMEWSYQGTDHYVQFFAPSFQDMVASPEYMIAEMDYAGIDVAVLQNAHLYGRTNEYFADAVRRFPGRFVSLAEVDEVKADGEEEIQSLRRAVEELGCKGLYYATRGFFFADGKKWLDDERYAPLWEEVQSLGISMWWEIGPMLKRTPENFLEQVRRLNRWLERYPNIPSVFTHGIAPDLLGTGGAPMAREIEELLGHSSVTVEILYPIGFGGRFDYPYPEVRPAIEKLCRTVGAERLVWGSDMPNVLRFCTYRQSLDYLRRYCDFIAPSDMDLILGGNLQRLFRL